jgi:hypothetical protein
VGDVVRRSSKDEVRSEAQRLLEGKTPSIRLAYLDEPLRLNRVNRS